MWYEDAARLVGRHFPLKVDIAKSSDFYELTRFSGLRVSQEDASALAFGSAVVSALVLGFLTSVAFFTGRPWRVLFFLTALFPAFLVNYLGNYPRRYAERHRIKILGTVPEAISNMAMSLKITPNLEKALEFAAERTPDPLGRELKRLVWGIYMQLYSTPEEALTDLAERWKRWDEEFSQALYHLKGSMLERSEVERINSIDRAVKIVFEGTSEKMGEFARDLEVPTVSLYFLGLIMPLILMAVLPTFSYIGIAFRARILVLAYNLIIPLIVYLWSRSILEIRPVTMAVAEIPDAHPGLPQPGRFGTGRWDVPVLPVAVFGGLLFFVPGFIGLLRIVKLNGGNSFLGLDLVILVMWGLCLFASIYLLGHNLPQYEIRSEMWRMEEEFADALIHLGNRLGEGRPFEDAFRYVSGVMKGSKIGGVFSRAGNLISFGGMTLENSLFDEDEGAFKDIHSDLIRGVMKILVEGTERGGEIAATMVLRISEHLARLREVEGLLREKLESAISSMRYTVLYFGPFVGGVVVVLQEVMNTQLRRYGQGGGIGLPGEGSLFGSLEESVRITPVPTGIMQLVVGVYLLEMVTIFSLYITHIEGGDDRTVKNVAVGKNLLISSSIFTLGIIASSALF